ncbi:endonuclease, partial [Kaistella sp.]|uniref:endonuclease n=1 Tax=Kaistella sp. TaxID=2782235 RepID=UPI002F957ADE
FNSNYPMYSDLFYVIPTDARINQLRSNYPYGIAKTTTTPFYTFTNGSRISANGTPGSGYTGRVYEPIDEFKGDIARSLLYFAVRYEGKLGLFNYYNGTSAANDRSPLDGTEEKAFEDWYLNILLQWHNQDPVSQREIDRNNEVYALQKNRNPFIDYPQWVNAIWNQTANSLEPQAPTNLSITQTSAYFVNLSWTPSPDADVIGYKIYQNDVLIAYTKDTSVSIDHLEPSTFYNFKVQAYDNSYYQSMYSNTVSATTLATDIYAKDLMITKYLEGSENNRAIEITNKTGHPVNLNKYRLSTQFYNNTAGNYYFPDAYELEGLVQHNETFVVLNPYSNFSCITNDEARFVTAAPQLSFSGSQYLELRYASTTVDAVGIKDMSNSSVLGDVSLYRLSSVTQPSITFTLSEWEAFPADYCENLGVLATSDVGFYSENNWSVYPNPVVGNSLYVEGKQLENVQEISVFDLSGKLVQQESRPFKNKNSVNVQNLKPGVYILNIDHKSLKFIKK